jgi:mitochondrial distribution and morphology protein 12
MSIDLDWDKLGLPLSSSLVDTLNRQLTSTARPSFIGPVEVTSLDFGSTAPDVELVDLRDIYRDFLEDDEDDDDDLDPVKVTEGAEDDEAYEWVSRRAAGRAAINDELGPAYHHLPPHIRYGRSPSADLFSSAPALHTPRDLCNGGMSLPNLGDFRQTYPARPSPPFYRSPPPSSPFSSSLNPLFDVQTSPSISRTPDGNVDSSHSQPENEPEQPPNNHPNLQLHLHINWHSNLRITLTTSLLINYPSAMFMSLPIKLSVTGLFFDGEIAVAYEGQRRRVHLCILDDLDPYGPACDRSKRESVSSTPPEPDEDLPSRPSKPLPVGQRLLPSIFIESEIGQADKHVLKNVTRVERFIADVIRKTVEEELVFPNFHTLVMGDQ